MKLFVHLCLWAAVPITLAVMLLNLADSWFDDREGVFQLGHMFVFEARRTEALQRRTEMVAQSDEIKRDIIAELLAGRLTLREAVDRFREANQMVENTDWALVADYQVPTTEEGLYRQVIAWVEGETAILSPGEVKPLLVPLVKEYESLFGPLKSAEEPQEPPESAEEPPLLTET
jgi:hypothetical protein